MKRMREGDYRFFFKFYRMTPALFHVLLSFVALDLTKIHVSRETLKPGERLAITLSYLVQGKISPLLLWHIEWESKLPAYAFMKRAKRSGKG
ncbi:hypothetical protein MRX96_027505 [Rhipicephalus microplus]